MVKKLIEKVEEGKKTDKKIGLSSYLTSPNNSERKETPIGLEDLDLIEVIAFRKVNGMSQQYSRKNLYKALEKLACEYCANCHCATR